MLKASFCRVDEGMNKVSGLGFGADDYMTKPFHKDELVARIHAIVRRSKGHAQSVVCFSAVLRIEALGEYVAGHVRCTTSGRCCGT
jgi:two-component system cell cycle response regulator CtrA